MIKTEKKVKITKKPRFGYVSVKEQKEIEEWLAYYNENDTNKEYFKITKDPKTGENIFVPYKLGEKNLS